MMLYYIAIKIDAHFYSVMMSGRTQQIDLWKSLVHFPARFKYAYNDFFKYFLDWRIKRNWMYVLLFLLFVVALAFAFIRLISKRKGKEALAFCILIGTVPMALNSIAFICTEEDISNLMTYQMVLVMPFGIALLERCCKGIVVYLQVLAALICSLIGWTYVISSNMTYRCWDLSNRRIHFLAENILADLVAMPEYEEGKRIIFAGFMDGSVLRNEYWLLYQHAFGMVSWWRKTKQNNPPNVGLFIYCKQIILCYNTFKHFERKGAMS